MHSGFNPKARWDRHIPQRDDSQDPGELNERIAVLAFFKSAEIYPRLFIWNHKRYRIKNITYHWQEHRGRETISCFTVNTTANLYQISFNNTSYSWKIDKIIE